MKHEPALLTIPEAAEYIAVPVNTLRHWIFRTRQIPSVSLGRNGKRGPRRVKKADLDRLIEQSTVPALRLVAGGKVERA